MGSELPKQDFVIKTPNIRVYGTAVKKDGEWIVGKIDQRMFSMKGIPAKTLKERCERWGWELERC